MLLDSKIGTDFDVHKFNADGTVLTVSFESQI